MQLAAASSIPAKGTDDGKDQGVLVSLWHGSHSLQVLQQGPSRIVERPQSHHGYPADANVSFSNEQLDPC